MFICKSNDYCPIGFQDPQHLLEDLTEILQPVYDAHAQYGIEEFVWKVQSARFSGSKKRVFGLTEARATDLNHPC
jgi:hypothetical protein